MIPPLTRSDALKLISDECDTHGVSLAHLFGQIRHSEVHRLRLHIAKSLWELGFTSSEIGRAMCRDHSTVLYWKKNKWGENLHG